MHISLRGPMMGFRRCLMPIPDPSPGIDPKTGKKMKTCTTVLVPKDLCAAYFTVRTTVALTEIFAILCFKRGVEGIQMTQTLHNEKIENSDQRSINSQP
jgi:hypothetical protein